MTDPDHPAGPGAPLPPRREAFCQHYVVDPNGTVAAVEAGYAPGSARQEGYRLLNDPAVAARISELRADMASRHGRAVDDHIAKLETVYRKAMTEHHFHAAVRAVEAQARLARLAAARRTNDAAPDAGPGEATDPDPAAIADPATGNDGAAAPTAWPRLADIG